MNPNCFSCEFKLIHVFVQFVGDYSCAVATRIAATVNKHIQSTNSQPSQQLSSTVIAKEILTAMQFQAQYKELVESASVSEQNGFINIIVNQAMKQKYAADVEMNLNDNGSSVKHQIAATQNQPTVPSAAQVKGKKITITMVPNDKALTKESFELYKKYQISIHEDKKELTEKGFKEFLIDSPLIVS